MTTPAGASILGRTGWDGGARRVDRERREVSDVAKKKNKKHQAEAPEVSSVASR